LSQVIADRFELERLVGAGGMGEVFRAKDRVTGGTVAVKVLYASMSRDLERFQREAQILAEVSHPRIVKYVAHGVAMSRPYLAMEWLDGEDLAERLAKKGLSQRESIQLTKRVAEALSVLHERGVVHRDIKPSNIFLVGGDTDNIKLLDLGVARLLHASRPSTRSGVMVGTPGYMAPEQARGAKEIDARADVFSLGCVLFECLAGKPVFAAENIAALLAKILLESPPSLREQDVDVPPALDALVTRMLAKHAAARPANGSAVLRELDAFGDIKAGPAHRASVPQQRALTGSERRLVSVVMASFGESGAVDEPVPMSAQETAAASFDPRSIVASFGAEAEMLADGSVVVTVMGKGGAGDQAAHAARCALALRSHLLTAQVALATGLADVTGKGPVGEVIERAAAILSAVRKHARGASEETAHGHSPVFLDETTAGLLDMRFDVGGDDRGLFIRGLRERETRPRTLLGKPTPFVGRDRELSTLIGLFEECVGEPVARAVLVTGAAGAGKSRMTAEVLKRISEEGVAEVWLARGDPMSEGSPFSLLARLVRRAAGISGGESLVVRQQKLRARLGRHLKDPDLSRVVEFIGEAVSVPFPDAQSVQLRAARQDSILMGDQMRRAFSDLVVAESGAKPLVVVIEDLHWGDLPSVNLLDVALRTAQDRPFMLLAVARPEVHDHFPGLWEQRSLQEIRVGPLMRRAGERLVKDVLGEAVAADVVNRLLDRAGGNVFYLEELIRAYAEGGERPATLTGTVPPPPPSSQGSVSDKAWSLPGTVLAMVEARLERLDPMARRVLRAASIFGEVFWRGGVLALTGGDYKASEVDDWLNELARREIVQRRDVSRFPSDHEYVFRHALVRDAAYQMLTVEDRALGHRLAGEFLERAGEHEPMTLAEHYERGGAKDKAISSYARAALQALEGNDFAAAKVRSERAMTAGAVGDQLGKLHLLLAEASRWAGDHEVASRNARLAMHKLPRASDDWFVAAAEAVDAAMTAGHLEEARTAADAVVEQLATGAVTAARVVAASRIAVRLVVAGAFETADAVVGRIERDATAILDAEPSARAFYCAARVARAQWLGDMEESAIYSREAVECFEKVGDVRNAALQRDNAGYALLCLGAFPAAEATLREAIEAADRLGLPVVSNEARLHLGQLMGRLQRTDEAIALIKEVIGGFAAQRDRFGEGRARGYLAGAYKISQQYEAAEEEARRALQLFSDSAPYRASVLALIAMACVDRGDGKAAIEAALEANKLLEQLGGTTLEIQAIIGLAYAEALRACGDIEGSKRAIAASRDKLLSRANKIKNPEWRRGFTAGLQEHVRILMRAGEWLA
jgi:tetratricopeptide (TPR) repeat protein